MATLLKSYGTTILACFIGVLLIIGISPIGTMVGDAVVNMINKQAKVSDSYTEKIKANDEDDLSDPYSSVHTWYKLLGTNIVYAKYSGTTALSVSTTEPVTTENLIITFSINDLCYDFDDAVDYYDEVSDPEHNSKLDADAMLNNISSYNYISINDEINLDTIGSYNSYTFVDINGDILFNYVKATTSDYVRIGIYDYTTEDYTYSWYKQKEVENTADSNLYLVNDDNEYKMTSGYLDDTELEIKDEYCIMPISVLSDGEYHTFTFYLEDGSKTVYLFTI